MTVAPHSDPPAPVGRRSPGVAVGLAALLFAAVTALRGRLPESGPVDTARPAESNPVTVAGILLLLSVSMLITAVALLTRPPRQPVPVLVEEPRLPGGSGVWSLRRAVILVAGLTAAVVVAALLHGLLPDVTGPGVAERPGPSLPPDGQTVPGPRAARPAPPDDDVFGYLAASVAVMAVVLVVSAVIARRRGRPGPAPLPAGEEPAPVGPAPLVVAAERALAAVEDLHRTPREAIIACYRAMETAFGDAPGAAPRESDTPSEVLARAVATGAVRAGDAATLVEVFAEARFSAHTMTEHHREVAEQALRAVLDDLRSTR